MLLFANRSEEALEVIKRAIRLCPIRLMWHLTILGQCQQQIGELELATATFREAVLKGPHSPFPRICLIGALVEAGEMEEAKRIAREVLRLESNFSLSNWRAMDFRDLAVRKRNMSHLMQAGLPS